MLALDRGGKIDAAGACSPNHGLPGQTGQRVLLEPRDHDRARLESRVDARL